MLKLVLDEDGSDVAEELWDSTPRAVSSRLAYPEACAGIGLAQRQGRLVDGGRKAASLVETTFEQIVPIDLTDTIARRAGALARARSLRGTDAVHLASALASLEPGGLIVTWDGALSRAAALEGLSTAP